MAHEHEDWQIRDDGSGNTYCAACGEGIPLRVADIARRLNPVQCQMAVARAMVAMGASPEWDSEMIEHVATPMLAIGQAAGLPTFTSSSDEAATAFWQSVD